MKYHRACESTYPLTFGYGSASFSVLRLLLDMDQLFCSQCLSIYLTVSQTPWDREIYP